MKKMYTQRSKIANPQDITTMYIYIFYRMNAENVVALRTYINIVLLLLVYLW